MEFIFTALVGIFLCLPFITSGRVIQQLYGNELRDLQCHYNRNVRTPYFCCNDKKEEFKIDYNSIRRHPNRQLFEDGNCAHGNFILRRLDEDFYQADIHEISWTALFKFEGRLISSGTLINNRYVLTSARHAKRFENALENVVVVLGDYDISKSPDCQTMENGKNVCKMIEIVGVEGIYFHQNFSETDLTNNIALVRLNNEIEFSMDIQPVCLPFTEMQTLSLLNNRYTVYGHGISFDHGSETNITTKNSVYIMDRYECEVLYRRISNDESNRRRKFDDHVFCVKPKEIPPVCVPDDGGALSQNRGNIHYQMGVASFSNDVCSLQLPFVYTNVTHYLKWILDTVTD
ncbi:serine protease grass-like isoform X2 [Leptopilina heterotoma]|uniref:serine protease grass-like isoform X2 n=1 Tax=Leptopilina heterotoma TaxID=63436 RepID=UPI001CA8D5C4|nr:serine protease grass-like isoform X2 [Leptopilina heterotoma]